MVSAKTVWYKETGLAENISRKCLLKGQGVCQVDWAVCAQWVRPPREPQEVGWGHGVGVPGARGKGGRSGRKGSTGGSVITSSFGRDQPGTNSSNPSGTDEIREA